MHTAKDAAARSLLPVTFHRDDLPPFLIEYLQIREHPDRETFTPAARLLLTRSLRTSGLLQALPESEVKTLLFVVTLLNRNGQFQVTVPELSEAMQLPEAKVRARMQRLTSFVWQGEPIAFEVLRESGLNCFSLSGHIIGECKAVEHDEDEQGTPCCSAALPRARREAVIAHSRARFARPRAEVEQMIAKQLGHTAEVGDGPEAEARRRLSLLGVAGEQIDLLLVNHSLEEIIRQLDWLPYRNAKSPARFVVAAIEQSYEPPAYIRLQQALGADAAAAASEKAEGQAQEDASVAASKREMPPRVSEMSGEMSPNADTTGADHDQAG